MDLLFVMLKNDENKIAEDAQTYKGFALAGLDLMFPVKLKGKAKRPDIKLMYHVTIMLFDVEKDTPEQVHEIAHKLALYPPDPKELTVKMATMKGRTGYNLYNINLHGPETKRLEELFNQFSSMGYHSGYKFQAHITVDKETWDAFQKEDGKTAFEAGIEFLPAELRQGDKLVVSYDNKYNSLNKSEIDMDTMKETILLNPGLGGHSKAIVLPLSVFKNYLQDNPGLEQEILKKHEDRITHHFGENKELSDFALKHGIKKTYEFMRKK